MTKGLIIGLILSAIAFYYLQYTIALIAVLLLAALIVTIIRFLKKGP